MPRAQIGMTGQNKVWLAGNTLMLGLLQGDRGLVDRASSTIFNEVEITT
jgi:chondroitin AC lyase